MAPLISQYSRAQAPKRGRHSEKPARSIEHPAQPKIDKSEKKRWSEGSMVYTLTCDDIYAAVLENVDFGLLFSLILITKEGS